VERETVIEIKDLKIDYRNLNHFSIQQIIRNPALKGRGVIHAIRGLDLTVKEGEILGVIGANGAGKSTLLKAITGIFQPDSGSIDTHGRRVSLMSLGVGFKWELSGRENIMIAGLLLHYPASYIRSKMQEIIDFSELGDDIDRPVRTYSSGMYSKLSFAITAVLETDVMLVDELLSVGDEQFQAKSFEKMQSLVRDERTTGIIVSHDMELLKDICTRVIWMDSSRIIAGGDPEYVIGLYVRWSAEKGAAKPALHDDFRDVSEEKLAECTAMFRGLDVNERTGKLINAADGAGLKPLGIAVNWEPVPVPEGTRISLKGSDMLYRVFTYKNDINDVYIYTRCFSSEGNKAAFDADSSVTEWQDGGEWSAPTDMFIRIELMNRGGKEFPADMFLEDLVQMEFPEGGYGRAFRDCGKEEMFLKEAERVAERVNELREEKNAVIMVLSDSHYSAGSNWNDTVFCLSAVGERVRPDALVNLGDITDGTFPKAADRRVSARLRGDMEGCGCPVHICPGNHDIHLQHKEDFEAALPGLHKPPYFEDLRDQGVRMIFLDSYDPGREIPYGFSDEEISWLSDTLGKMPEKYGAVLFSHVNPSESRTRWDEEILNAGRLMEILDDHSRKRPGCILGLICGHDHEDRIRTEHAFPVISENCSLIEDHSGSRPLYDGRTTRRKGTESQELFDVLVINKDKNRLSLVRFGAGEDRYAEVK